MKHTLVALALSAALVTPAVSGNGTWMCQVGHASYPVKLTNTPNQWGGPLIGGTITWRGTVFHNVKLVEGGCKANFTATRNGVTIELCAATQGVADLKIGEASFECQAQDRK
jgi:hypothetical protein